MPAPAVILAAGLVARNVGWSFRAGPAAAYQAAKAIRAKLVEAPLCAYCGKRASTAHHVIPVHLDESKAADRLNLVSTCGKCHLYVWHAGNFRRWISGLAWSMHMKQVVVEGPR